MRRHKVLGRIQWLFRRYNENKSELDVFFSFSILSQTFCSQTIFHSCEHWNMQNDNEFGLLISARKPIAVVTSHKTECSECITKTTESLSVTVCHIEWKPNQMAITHWSSLLDSDWLSYLCQSDCEHLID